ncbi:hypothetical protein J7E71_16325 [Mesobacillus foraminis]|uniref:hypothetical protein n=1 Tax=Mesobacillus foraminis TaxID=279826 RepID=UPI001BE8CEAB|nr:hypothetical protein [Mesobacillus foraminis]MBT2757485.1 hypothetical protein [Mesobacillus foraminis]
MRLEIGFMPHKWISDIPDASGYFPFAIDGKKEYIVDFTFNDDEPVEFVSNWMNEINQFPIYLLVEVYEFGQEEFEQDCKTYNIEFERTKFEKENECFYKAIIENYKQFIVMFPYVYGNGSMNNLALWSLKRDVFCFGERDFKTLFGIKKINTPIVTLLENDCIFWVGFDGVNVVAITNDSQFSTITNISKKFPLKTDFIISEFED